MVVLVNENDEAIGLAEKMAAHEQGLLHRAISVFIFSEDGKMLLQKRADAKYHCGGLWTNTCCSHPLPHETTQTAAGRRLKEEMGMTAELTFAFKFQYRAEFENGLTEHEIDHVFIGVTDQLPMLDPAEASAYRYVDIKDLEVDILNSPESYTPWFKICLERVLNHPNLQPFLMEKGQQVA